MVSAAMSCVKYLLFVFNLLFAVSGIAILVVGGIFQVAYHTYSPIVDENLIYAPITLIVIGIIVFVIAFFGCCGAVKENHCMITTFASLLLIVFILELAGGIAAYIFRDTIRNNLDQRMRYTLTKYENDEAIRTSWDILQADMKCCGVAGPSDWPHKLPNTCCKDISTDDTCTAVNSYEMGCVNKLEWLLENHILIVAGVGIGIAFIQLLGVIFACCLGRSIKRDYESV